MTGQFYFTTLAAIALSVAGFASLVAALRSDGRWSQDDLWRLRSIVRESLTAVVLSVLPLPIYYAVGGEEPLTIRVASGLIVANFAYAIWGIWRQRKDWKDAAWIRRAIVLVGLQLLLQLANVWLASLPLLMFGLLGILVHPMQLFLRVLADFRPPLDES